MELDTKRKILVNEMLEKPTPNSIISIKPIPVNQKPEKFVNTESGLRNIDNRQLEEIRKISITKNPIKDAKGSAYIEIGGTKILASANGPRMIQEFETIDKGALNVEVKKLIQTDSQISRSKSGNAGRTRRIMDSDFVRTALEQSLFLEKLPKCAMDLQIMVLEDDGNALALSITCGSLALALAGVEMRDIVCACSSVFIENQILVDPSFAEEKYATGSLLVGHMPSMKQITQFSQSGNMEYSKVEEAMEITLKACENLSNEIKKALIQ